MGERTLELWKNRIWVNSIPFFLLGISKRDLNVEIKAQLCFLTRSLLYDSHFLILLFGGNSQRLVLNHTGTL